MLTVQAKVDIKPLERKFTPAAMRGAKMAVADQVLADTDKYVPRREGDLAASGHVANGGEEVVYNTPYAAAQYRGTNGRQVFRKYTTPGTGKQWYEKSKQANLERWQETAKKALGVD